MPNGSLQIRKNKVNKSFLKGVYNHETLTFIFYRSDKKENKNNTKYKIIDFGKGYLTISTTK